MEVVVVVHGGSRGASDAVGRLPDALAARGLRLAALHVCEHEKALRRLVKAAARAAAPAVLVGGGDGAMAHAVDVLAHRPTALGVLPLGTGNSFARSLGIPLGLDDALDVVAAGRIARVDLGRVNGVHFANFATIGLGSRVAGATPRALKGITGSLAYALAAIVPLLRSRPFRARVRWEGGRFALRTEDLIVTSGRDFGRRPLVPDASIVDGRLELFAAPERGALDAIRTYVALGLGAPFRLPGAHLVRARSITVRTKRPQPLAIDGSTIGTTPARFRVVPGALRVFVPSLPA